MGVSIRRVTVALYVKHIVHAVVEGWLTFKIMCCYGIYLAGRRQEGGEKGKDRDRTMERERAVKAGKRLNFPQLPLYRVQLCV